MDIKNSATNDARNSSWAGNATFTEHFSCDLWPRRPWGENLKARLARPFHRYRGSQTPAIPYRSDNRSTAPERRRDGVAGVEAAAMTLARVGRVTVYRAPGLSLFPTPVPGSLSRLQGSGAAAAATTNRPRDPVAPHSRNFLSDASHNVGLPPTLFRLAPRLWSTIWRWVV